MADHQPAGSSWHHDPGWRVVAYDPERFKNPKRVPQKPTAQAELANPPVWASLYDGNRIVVTWYRPIAQPGRVLPS